jgi:GTP-binding protein YchF
LEIANIHHIAGSIDPVRDIEVITTELILADLATVKKRAERVQKGARSGDKLAKAELALCEKIQPHLDSGRPALTARLSDEERTVLKGFFLLTSKPVILACNIGENELAQADNLHIRAVRAFAAAQNAGAIGSAPLVEAVVISAQIESELAELPPEEACEFLSDLGVADSGVSQLIRAVYHLLGLRTYLTTGPKETRAWTIHAGDKAPAAAGVIHSDFERGFIAAQTIAFEDLVALGSEAKARDAGKLRVEGKDYVVRDGDVMEFRFNV